MWAKVRESGDFTPFPVRDARGPSPAQGQVLREQSEDFLEADRASPRPGSGGTAATVGNLTRIRAYRIVKLHL